MKKVRATIAVFALFSLACVGNQVTYKLLDTGEPLGGLDSDADSDADSDSDTDSDADVTEGNVSGFHGTMTITLGSSSKPKDYDCDLLFNATGAPAEVSCAECEWTLKFDLVYDVERSINEHGCHDGSNFGWTLGYDDDYYGGNYAMMWYYSQYYEWSPVFVATLDDAGGLVFGYGYLDYYYINDGVPYYYTQYWYGKGTLSY
jgi:hypothetical protein